MDIIDSDDSDLEMAFMVDVVIPSFRKQRKPPVLRQFNLREFDEDIPELVYRQQHRVPSSVIDFVEARNCTKSRLGLPSIFHFVSNK